MSPVTPSLRARLSRIFSLFFLPGRPEFFGNTKFTSAKASVTSRQSGSLIHCSSWSNASSVVDRMLKVQLLASGWLLFLGCWFVLSPCQIDHARFSRAFFVYLSGQVWRWQFLLQGLTFERLFFAAHGRGVPDKRLFTRSEEGVCMFVSYCARSWGFCTCLVNVNVICSLCQWVCLVVSICARMSLFCIMSLPVCFFAVPVCMCVRACVQCMCLCVAV